MAFAHQRMSGQSEAFKYLTPDNAMLDIWFFAAAEYAWRVGAENANVMQHRSLKSEFNIHHSPAGLVALAQLPGEIILEMKGGNDEESALMFSCLFYSTVVSQP